MPADLLEELRQRVKEGLSDEKRQEIARLLVKTITIRTKTKDGNRFCIAEVAYRFTIGAVSTHRDMRAAITTNHLLGRAD
jgi:hypothetical protein